MDISTLPAIYVNYKEMMKIRLE